MDLITYALLKRQIAESGVDIETIIPHIGENGNWYIGDKDTGVSALPPDVTNVDIADIQQEKDVTLYGVEYVPAPSDFFVGVYEEFISEGIQQLIDAEKEVLGKLQKADGGFDISWTWGTEYAEFEQARSWWRPRITIDKLLFLER